VAARAVAIAPPEPGRLAGALDNLADALALVAPQRADDIARVREGAADLERAGTAAGAHAGAVRSALRAAGDALRSLPIGVTTADGARLRDAADAVMLQAEAIDPARPLAPQYQLVRDALRASADAVYSALHVPTPPQG
jgi:hypothetical protein